MFVFVIAIQFNVFVIIPATFDLFFFYFLIFNCCANCLICFPNNVQKIHSFDWLFNKFCLPPFFETIQCVLQQTFTKVRCSIFRETVNSCWSNSCQIIPFDLSWILLFSYNFPYSLFVCLIFVSFCFISFSFLSVRLLKGNIFTFLIIFQFGIFFSPFISLIHIWFFS